MAIICRNDWTLKQLEFNNDFECLWCELTTTNSKYFIASVYHPPSPIYHDDDLLHHLTESCELILEKEPTARLVIAGDINQLNIKDLICQQNLKQMVRKATRGNNILDVFLTNCPHLWKDPTIFKSLVRSDHRAIVVTPKQPSKHVRKYVSFI